LSSSSDFFFSSFFGSSFFAAPFLSSALPAAGAAAAGAPPPPPDGMEANFFSPSAISWLRSLPCRAVMTWLIAASSALIPTDDNILVIAAASVFSRSLKMRIIGAYLLAVLGGNDNPDAAAINKILSSVGIKAEDEAINKVIGSLKGKDLNQLIAEGEKKFSSLPSGGGGGAAAPAAAAAGGAAKADDKKGAAKKEEPKKEEKKKSEEEDTMGFSLFD